VPLRDGDELPVRRLRCSSTRRAFARLQALPGTSPPAGSSGGAATTALATGSGGTTATPTTGPGATGGGTVNNYNYDISVNAANLARQEMKRVAGQIHRELERMDRKQSTATPG
jgi:hypothetical protein